MARHKDFDWNLPDGKRTADGKTTHSWEAVHASLLMDIRDELKRLNSLLYCRNFLDVPHTLKRIDRRLAKKVPLR
jgi:hypothetical protein